MSTPEFDMEDWLAGIEPPQEGVTVYQKPGLVARIEKAKEALKSSPTTERAMGDPDPTARIRAMQDELAASKTVWYVSPLSREVEKRIAEQYPEPELGISFDVPRPRLADRATPEQAAAWMTAQNAWKEEHAEWTRANAAALTSFQQAYEDCSVNRGVARIAACVTYIETFDSAGVGTRKPVHLTPEFILEAERKLGAAQLGLVGEALNRVSSEVPDPDPFM